MKKNTSKPSPRTPLPWSASRRIRSARRAALDGTVVARKTARKFVTNNVNLTTITSALYTSVVAAVQPASSMYRANLGSAASTADSYYKVKDVRRKKFSGTGSLGRLRLYVLIDGPSTADSDDRILEVKME